MAKVAKRLFYTVCISLFLLDQSVLLHFSLMICTCN